MIRVLKSDGAMPSTLPESDSNSPEALTEATGLLRGPQRVVPLIQKLVSDKLRVTFEQRHLYSYTTTKRRQRRSARTHCCAGFSTRNAPMAALRLTIACSRDTRNPTLRSPATSFRRCTILRMQPANDDAVGAAERATRWLLSLQMPTGAFPGGLHGKMGAKESQPSVFNSGQILHGLVRAHAETNRAEILQAVVAAGDWLVKMQQADGSWSGPAAYQKCGSHLLQHGCVGAG